jgi:hypothetical protein
VSGFRQNLADAAVTLEAVPPVEGWTSLFASYLRFTPVLWALGALIPCAVVMLIKLAIERWPKGKLINTVILLWLAIAIAQASCSILNGIILHDIGKGLRNALSFTAIGWAFGALAIAIGNGWALSTRHTAGLVANLGGYIILLSLIAAVGTVLGVQNLRMSTPLGMILPAGNATNFYASMTIYQSEDTLGEARTRLILFFPWATALGLGALAIALISTRAEQVRWRVIGMIGGVVGTVFSWSRIALATLVLVAALLIFIKLPRYLQVLSVTMIAIGIYGLSVFGLDPVTLIANMHRAADEARAGSSIARDLIYQKSWEGFLQSPVIGNGWIGESVHRIEDLPIGSHSTIYGVLYTGGAITFTCYVLAMLTTLMALGYGIYHWREDKERQQNAIIGLCLWLSLLLYCPYESLFSLTLPCLFLFTWIGGAIPGGEGRVARRPVSLLPGSAFQVAAPAAARKLFKIDRDQPGAEKAETREDGFSVFRAVQQSPGGKDGLAGDRQRRSFRFRANA